MQSVAGIEPGTGGVSKLHLLVRTIVTLFQSGIFRLALCKDDTEPNLISNVSMVTGLY
jgi:hypothetical protein